MENMMKAYKGSFKKRNGEIRSMLFAKIQDLPDAFLEEKIIGTGSDKSYPDGMELVWDLEEDNFRVFNWKTVEGPVKELTVDQHYHN
jgi:hypothetical protein